MDRARARGKQIGRAPASNALIDAIRALRADGMGMDRIARNLKCGKEGWMLSNSSGVMNL